MSGKEEFDNFWNTPTFPFLSFIKFQRNFYNLKRGDHLVKVRCRSSSLTTRINSFPQILGNFTIK